MLDEDNLISVLVPDGESHLLIHVVNCLLKIKRIRIYIMSDKRKIAMRYSNNITNFSYYPVAASPKDWIKNINTELKKFHIDIILPVFEIGIRNLIQHKNRLTCPDKLLTLPNLENFDIAIDKWHLSLHMTKYGIAHPKTYKVQDNSLIRDIEYPIIIKPTKDYGGGMGVYRIDSYDGLHNFLDKSAQKGTSYIVQEYIHGLDYCCNVLCCEGKIISNTIQKGTLWGVINSHLN